MRTWFTADLHLGHGNIIKYCQRPFLTDEERERARTDPRGRWRVSEETVRRHDNALIEAINTGVGADDVLWVLGDFCWGGLAEAREYRDRIRCGNVHLVWGNHDQRSIRPVFGKALEQGMIQVSGVDIWLCHYPMRTWDRRFHGSWHLYGHVHGRFVAEDNRNPTMLTRDVGVDACNYLPLSFEDLQHYMAPRIEQFQKHKEGMVRGEEDPIV